MNPDLLFEKSERPTKSFHLGIAEKDDNEVIGDLWVYLIENDRMAQVAIRLSKEKLGKVLLFSVLTVFVKLTADKSLYTIGMYQVIAMLAVALCIHIYAMTKYNK